MVCNNRVRNPLATLSTNHTLPKTVVRRKPFVASAKAVPPPTSVNVDHINRLPTELISAIFAASVHDERLSLDYDASVRVFTGVCRRWRKIAIGSVNFWTTLYITNPDRQHHLIEQSLARSGTRPIDIHLGLMQDYDFWDIEEKSERSVRLVFEGYEDDDDLLNPELGHPIQEEQIEGVLALLIPHAHRWRSISVTCEIWTPIYAFLDGTQNVDLPVLESLSLVRKDDPNEGSVSAHFEPSYRAPLPLFGGRTLPSLRHVSLVAVHIDWEASLLGLSNLHTLELKKQSIDVRISWESLAHILAASPDMRRLSLVAAEPDFRSMPSAGFHFPEMPNLAELEFGVSEPMTSLHVLVAFSCPNLQTLSLEDMEVSDAFHRTVSADLTDSADMSAFVGYLARPNQNHDAPVLLSLEKLQTLKLNCVSARTDVWEDFFARLRSLHTLEVKHPRQGILEALADASQVPTLQHIKFTGNASLDAMFDVAEARLLPPKPKGTQKAAKMGSPDKAKGLQSFFFKNCDMERFDANFERFIRLSTAIPHFRMDSDIE
ncbi:hypothetical protein CYLTODRAFT_488303 [Cylindrobasidium torrendii FP15055 ss-10]|uniref:Uncharacterized protein n=1 Tax=Cylindrobasidium torrendii FP15055 ss-10 TaxID=1314674 RepID=A0A0D7BIT8_9AGAR|nr:hypothetical protein CYLTODRAFT_488303 [Cylindrobasidium torrendii FP15055 ss-10]